jgi:hypothetical protein
MACGSWRTRKSGALVLMVASLRSSTALSGEPPCTRVSLADPKLAGDLVAQWYAAVTSLRAVLSELPSAECALIRLEIEPESRVATAPVTVEPEVATPAPVPPRAPAAQIDERALGFQLSAAAGARVGFHGTGGTRRFNATLTIDADLAPGSISAPRRVDEALPPLPSWTLGLRAGVAGDLS